jgi:dihydroneopterin aldolase
MADPVDLLETVCQRIAKKIQIQYPDYLTIEISLSKEHPPLGMAGGRSKVRWTVRNE